MNIHKNTKMSLHTSTEKNIIFQWYQGIKI